MGFLILKQIFYSVNAEKQIKETMANPTDQTVFK